MHTDRHHSLTVYTVYTVQEYVCIRIYSHGVQAHYMYVLPRPWHIPSECKKIYDIATFTDLSFCVNNRLLG